MEEETLLMMMKYRMNKSLNEYDGNFSLESFGSIYYCVKAIISSLQ